MPRAKKTPEERLQELEQKRAQLLARIQKEKAVLRQRDRKQDTRRKIIAGAVVLETAANDPQFKNRLDKLLHNHVTRPEDRKLFNLPTHSE